MSEMVRDAVDVPYDFRYSMFVKLLQLALQGDKEAKLTEKKQASSASHEEFQFAMQRGTSMGESQRAASRALLTELFPGRQSAIDKAFSDVTPLACIRISILSRN
jgi:hypothetical protein